jgi:FdhD protein
VAPRLAVATSSCGVCGKRTIDEVLSTVPCGRVGGAGLRVPARVIASLPETLRKAQAVFDSTGAIHAAGLFDVEGRLHALEEDVGRHNAVDKVSGWALLAGQLPLDASVLFVSGRVSFEVVQKAFRAGVPFVAGVSGVSSLACDLARRAGITLAGFVRGRKFSLYSCPERVEA